MEKGCKVDAGQPQPHRQQHPAQKDGPPHLVHPEADPGAEGEEKREKNRRLPPLAVDQKVIKGEAAERFFGQRYLDLHKRTSLGVFSPSITQPPLGGQSQKP